MTSNKQPAESNAGETSFQDIGVRTVESLEIRNSSDQITSTLQHIVHQIDVLTQTMSILEVLKQFVLTKKKLDLLTHD